MGIQTIKFRYEIDDAGRKVLGDAIRQYNSCVRIAYNMLFDEEYASIPSKLKRQNEIAKRLSGFNNVELILAKMREYATRDAIALKERFGDKRVCFGGWKNLSRYNGHLISKDEFLQKRRRPMSLEGKCLDHGNTFCIANPDKTVTLKLNRKTHLALRLVGCKEGKRDRGTWKILSKIAELQKEKVTPFPISYKIDSQYVYISFQNTILSMDKPVEKRVQNRTFSIDMNPNFIGWSINDWDNNGDNILVEHGTFSVESLNEKDRFIKGKSGKSKLKDKRNHEICIIAKKLAQKAAHFRCNVVGFEDLDGISKNSKDHGSTRTNRLINGNWVRKRFESCFTKWLNVYGYDFDTPRARRTESVVMKVLPQYSSFIGNIVYGDKYRGTIPDPECASIEIGRRAHEFLLQHILKAKEKTGIVYPPTDKLAAVCVRAMEAIGMDGKFEGWKEMKKQFDLKKVELSGKKNAKDMYRVPFGNSLKWFKSQSKRSLILKTRS
jgi:hypothetical protein